MTTWLRRQSRGRVVSGLLAVTLMAATLGTVRAAEPARGRPQPKITNEVAADVSRPLRDLAREASPRRGPVELPEERGPTVTDQGHSGDRALQSEGARSGAPLADVQSAPSIGEPLVTFEGLSNQDNANIFGFRVNPPDPVGDVGPNHYVQMTNLAYAVYDKQGNVLVAPADIGTLWAGFPVTDCIEAWGDPIVLYDQLADRWLLSQFTANAAPYYNCIAISQTGDPTGAYYRYAYSAGDFFPDYPKYGVWNNMYVLTTRDFGDLGGYGISIYALERNKMINGETKARAVQFFLDSEQVPISEIGDGLLPPDIDGNRRPRDGAPAPIVGTQDDEGPYGATFDALNVYELSVQWRSTPRASLSLPMQLPVAEFDSAFPCAPTSRDCLPQPGVTDPTRYLDILSYRQRPTFRLAYRNFGTYEALVTSQSVEARPGIAGMRWYEIRRTNGSYSVHQQGTYSANDGVHRWMGSAAMDWQGNIALGYSVVDGTSVFPGIRYTGRLSDEPLGQMGLGEGTIVNGSGVQTTTNSRWGDYSSMNVDPTDDCTFWYVNEYYTAAGQASSPAGWQTRVGAFRLPGCTARS